MTRALFILVLCAVSVICQDVQMPNQKQIDLLHPLRYPIQGIFPPIPCPRVFQYRLNMTMGWFYGHITVPKFDNTGIYILEVNMSVNANVQQHDGIKIVVLSPQRNILLGRVIEYGVLFPHIRSLPTVTQILFNGRIYCSGQPPAMQTDKPQSAMWARSTITTGIGGSTGDPYTTTYSPTYPNIFNITTDWTIPTYFTTDYFSTERTYFPPQTTKYYTDYLTSTYPTFFPNVIGLHGNKNHDQRDYNSDNEKNHDQRDYYNPDNELKGQNNKGNDLYPNYEHSVPDEFPPNGRKGDPYVRYLQAETVEDEN